MKTLKNNLVLLIVFTFIFSYIGKVDVAFSEEQSDICRIAEKKLIGIDTAKKKYRKRVKVFKKAKKLKKSKSVIAKKRKAKIKAKKNIKKARNKYEIAQEDCNYEGIVKYGNLNVLSQEELVMSINTLDEKIDGLKITILVYKKHLKALKKANDLNRYHTDLKMMKSNYPQIVELEQELAIKLYQLENEIYL